MAIRDDEDTIAARRARREAQQPEDTTTAAAGTTETPTSPWWTAPTDGNWEAWFRRNLGRDTLTSSELKALEGDLSKAGVKVLTNSAGVSGKIQLPDGTIIDVIQAAGAGGNRLQWLTGAGEGASSAERPITVNPEYLQPWTREFTFEGFNAPDYEALLKDPGYKVRLAEGAGVLQNSAAARGLLNSGGTLYDLLNYGQRAASQEYQNAWDRYYNLWNTNRANAWQQYIEDKNSWYSNQENPFSKLYRMAGLGAQAASTS